MIEPKIFIFVMTNIYRLSSFCRSVAPFLNQWLRDSPGVLSLSGAHLLGHIHALLLWLQFRNQLGDKFAGFLRFKIALLSGLFLNHSLNNISALLCSLIKLNFRMNVKHEYIYDVIYLSEATPSRRAKASGLLLTGGDWGELLDILLGDAAHLLGPLVALGVGGVSGGLVLALLLNLGLAPYHIILHLMDLLLGPALGLVLSAADLLALDVAILD